MTRPGDRHSAALQAATPGAEGGSSNSTPGRVMHFPPPAKPISMNEGDSWSVRTRAAEWRDRSYWAWCEQFDGLGPSGRAMPPSDVYVSLPFDRNIRRDPINFAKTVKHVVDGIMLAGAWPDDTPEFVTQHVPHLRIEPNGVVVVRVVPR